VRLKLSVEHRGDVHDVLVVADANTTVGAVIERIEHQLGAVESFDGQSTGLMVNAGTPRERVLTTEQPLGDGGLRSGDVVAITTSAQSSASASAPVATLQVISGPDAPREFALHAGTNYLGRDRAADIRLSDPLVSQRHAKINVTDLIEVIDDGSSNGIIVGGQAVDRSIVRPGSRLAFGDTEVTIALTAVKAGNESANEIAFNRSPRLDPLYAGIELVAPEPPKPPSPPRFPIVSLIAPIMMAGMIYTVTRNVTSLLFVALSPLMMIGGWFENRRSGGKQFEQAKAQYRSAVLDLSVQLEYAADLERAGRRAEHPSAAEIEEATRDLSDLLWTRRPEHDSFLCCRVGLGSRPSRNSVEMPRSKNTTPELWKELTDVVGQFSIIDRVPVVARLADVGNIGICGPQLASEPVLSNVVGQFAALHSPAELVIVGIASESAANWDWLKWLPHTGSEFSPIEVGHLASNTTDANTLVSAVEEVIEDRQSKDGDVPLPVILVVVGDDAPIERARLVQIAERGPSAGVHVIWHAVSRQRLPAACRIFIDSDPVEPFQIAGIVPGGDGITDLEAETIDAGSIAALARRLSPVSDSGTRADDQTDLPRSVSFLELAGPELGSDVDAIIESWRANNSLPLDPSAPRPKRDNTLRALVGQGPAGPIHLDLRTQGPHALVGGTTGAGKSEFLQSWVLGMASMHSPSRVAFLFVDYKGGSAFAECVDLPHTVGLVTDLSPYLVQRALISLRAELHRREHLLNDKKAKDLFELEKRNDPEAPPSLVIVVDEFAALATEVPEFVDGVVDVAQRGRSLGLNLILATQRPAGVIKDNLRANTNLRVALRMADEADSDDVVGSKLAATFDPGIPGRGVVKTGPGRLTTFQSAYAGGQTTGEPPRPNLAIHPLTFGSGIAWEPPPEPARSQAPDVPTDIKRLVSTIAQSARQQQIPRPRQPWLPELSPTYSISELPGRRIDSELVFGVVDDPKSQAQPEIAFYPDSAGNMAVIGASGSGKSTFLRSIAIAAAQGYARGGPTHVYGLDFGSRGLQMLEELPHVGSIISGDDDQRVQRLLRELRATINARAELFGTVNADSIAKYRTAADRPDEPRILLLVDGVGAFRTAYEGSSATHHYWETFQSIAADGRAAGVHVIVSADRPGAISTSLSSSIQERLVLRLANEMDYLSVDVDPDGFSRNSPPGRGFIGGKEVQVAVLGGVSNVASQAEQVRELARAMLQAGLAEASPVASLPEEVSFSELPLMVNGLPSLGIWDETLKPIGFTPSGTFLVVGPPLSGRTTTVQSMVQRLAQVQSQMKFVLFGQRRSPLTDTLEWSHTANAPGDAADLASDLRSDVEAAEPNSFCFVIESVGDFLNGDADLPLQQLVKAARATGQMVIAEGETSSLAGSWPLLQAVKVNRAGIVLQPDQPDGDNLFKTAFPRVSRRDFPLGRGLLVAGGNSYRVQVGLPESAL
jgi:S-DNA-T family DNA segregation ATPase FtsK/SpoIIIE